jgi:diketogulonate reductase-like aldo/keto reductase
MWIYISSMRRGRSMLSTSRKRGEQWRTSAIKVHPLIPATAHRALKSGLTKHIGVSNFRIVDLQRIFKIAKYTPVVNQIEFHPHLQQQKLRQFHEDHGIIMESFASLAPLYARIGSPLPAVVERIAETHGRTPAQVNILLCCRVTVRRSY